MNLRDLEYLDALARHGNFRRAAESIPISQPTLSVQVKRLEESLGVQLFERTPRRILLTAAGEKVLAKAREILLQVEDLKRIADEERDPFQGRVRIGVFPTLGPYLIPYLIEPIRQHYPRLELEYREEKTAVLYQLLSSRALDAVILSDEIEIAGFSSIELFTEPLLLAVSRQHPLAMRTSVSVSDLTSRALLLLDDGHCLREQTTEFCSSIKIREDVDFKISSLETLRQLVASDAGITLMPKLAVEKQSNRVAYIPFAEPAPSRKIRLLFPVSSARSELCAAIAELLGERVRGELGNA